MAEVTEEAMEHGEPSVKALQAESSLDSEPVSCQTLSFENVIRKTIPKGLSLSSESIAEANRIADSRDSDGRACEARSSPQTLYALACRELAQINSLLLPSNSVFKAGDEPLRDTSVPAARILGAMSQNNFTILSTYCQGKASRRFARHADVRDQPALALTSLVSR